MDLCNPKTRTSVLYLFALMFVANGSVRYVFHKLLQNYLAISRFIVI